MCIINHSRQNYRVLIKGGKYLETLASADVLLLDKTGTLILGQPQVTDILPLDGMAETQLLALAASAERYSEHPLAEAVRCGAVARHLTRRSRSDSRRRPA
jgi:P-type Cu+ transporter